MCCTYEYVTPESRQSAVECGSTSASSLSTVQRMHTEIGLECGRVQVHVALLDRLRVPERVVLQRLPRRVLRVEAACASRTATHQHSNSTSVQSSCVRDCAHPDLSPARTSGSCGRAAGRSADAPRAPPRAARRSRTAASLRDRLRTRVHTEYGCSTNEQLKLSHRSGSQYLFCPLPSSSSVWARTS